MDLLQRKLTKAEWESIEVPVIADEQRIIELIKDGYANVHLKRNYTLSLLRHLKIPYTDAIADYIYSTYLYPYIAKLYTKYKTEMPPDAYAGGAGAAHAGAGAKVTLKKADIIRFNTTEKQIHEHKDSMFEFVVLDFLETMLKMKMKKNKMWLFYYYTLQIITKYNIDLFNAQLQSFVVALLAHFEPQVDIPTLLAMSYDLIERNENLLKYADETLYDHQKQLFTLCKRPAPKLILYIAPTGTGKTLSPIGLSEGHRIIFVCAARHVGLALAKSAISAHKKVAFAFGCQSAEDIRLHFFAAKEYTKNKKSGGIGKVDNSVGDNVEIMICDIQSYLPAMFYMLAFNKKERLIMYWDEPTITLDIDTDANTDALYDSAPNPLHTIIKENWTKNLIPNIVLSSATLPRKEEISETICSFRERFAKAFENGEDPEIHEIISYDCKKTIPMLNKEGFSEMPHYLSSDYLEIKSIVEHTKNYKTLLRYLDLAEATRFILFVNDSQKGFIKKSRYLIAQQFPSVESVTMLNIKNYYLELLGNLNPVDWKETIYPYFIKTRIPKQVSTINIVTSDAYTLTDGPTIFLADDADKIAKFYIQQAEIPPHILKEISDAIAFNSVINSKTAVMEKDFQDGTSKDAEKEKKMGDADRLNPEMKRLMQKIEDMKGQIRTVMLDPAYVPNTKDHLYKHAVKMHTNSNSKMSKPFACDISEYNVEQIMLIDDIEDHWKLLLLMGIGVFSASVSASASMTASAPLPAPLEKTQNKSDRYTEIMKTLAQEQKLFMLIASSDYIYGTNYQFCHGYISKDLAKMSQEKCIQAMGRIGRNKLQHDYSIRFRDNELIHRLFRKDTNKPEIRNMNKLFI